MRRKSKSTRTQSRSRKTRGKVKRKSFRAKRKQSERSKFYSNLKSYLALVFVIWLFSDMGYRMFLRFPLRNFLIERNPVQIEATIVNRKNYVPNSNISPRDFTYSYRYAVDDKLYYEDSRIEGLKLWDRIPIEYSKSFPSFSRVIKEEFEEED